MGGGAARRGRVGASKVRRWLAQPQGIDMALPELACNGRPDPAHCALSSSLFVRPRALPLLPWARTRASARMRERACESASDQ